MKINNCQGDPADISVEKEALVNECRVELASTGLNECHVELATTSIKWLENSATIRVWAHE